MCKVKHQLNSKCSFFLNQTLQQLSVLGFILVYSNGFITNLKPCEI